MPPMAHNLTPPEIVYAAARSAGFETANIHIHGLDQILAERMWVLTPVGGVRVNAPMHVGAVGSSRLGRLRPDA
jgi:hypothetical protein